MVSLRGHFVTVNIVQNFICSDYKLVLVLICLSVVLYPWYKVRLSWDYIYTLVYYNRV